MNDKPSSRWVASAQRLLGVALGLALTRVCPAAEAPPTRGDIEKAIAAIGDCDPGKSRRPLFDVEQLVRRIGREAELTRYLEGQLLKVLAGGPSDECKLFICQQLWVIGSDAAVPTLAKMLLDETASHVACYAFGRNPSPKVGQALRDALPTARGKALLNLINALGDRRDAEAIAPLAKLAASDDPQAAEAALSALGRIGGEQAADALAEARKKADAGLRLAAAHAYLQCAEGLAIQGKKARAAAAYRELLGAGEPKLIRRGAFIGLVAMGGDEAVPLALSALRGDDAALRATAIAQIRVLKGEGVAERFAAELPKLPPATQALLLAALVERGGPTVRPAAVAAAKSESAAVRTAAMKALGQVGDAGAVALLAAALAEGRTEDEKNAASLSLRQLRAEGVAAALIQSMKAARADVRPPLIQVLLDRRVASAVPALLEEAAGQDEGARTAALTALGGLARVEDLPALLRLLVGLQGDGGRPEAERAAVLIARKAADEKERAETVLSFLGRTNWPAGRCSLLRVLGGIANAQAFEAVRAASKDPVAAVQDTAVRTLAAWPDAGATEALLEVFKTTSNETHRVLALRGYVRLLNLAGARPAEETVRLYREAMAAARRPDERKLVLAGLADLPHPGALDLALGCLDDAAAKAEATLAALKIARSLAATSGEDAMAAAKKLAAVAQDQAVRKEAEAILAQAEKFEDYLVAWQVAGPFTEAGKDFTLLFDIAFPPEQPDAKDVAWRTLPAGTDPARPMILDLKAALGGEQRCAYVRTWLYSPKEQPARLELGTDDGHKVWLNGRLVRSKNLGGKAVPGAETASVALRQGWNALLLKITQATGPWEFCLRVRRPDGTRLEGLRVDCLRGG